MKKIIKLQNISIRTAVLSAAVLMSGIAFTGCKKNTGSSNPQPGAADKLYPATLAFYNNTQYPENSVFKYDGDHNLTYTGNANRYYNIDAGHSQLIVIQRGDTMYNTYSFDRNIYTEKGIVNATNLVKWRYAGGLPPYQSAESKYLFMPAVGTDGQVGHANLGKLSQNITYDNNGNVASVTHVTNAWGSPNSTQYDPGGLVLSKITYKGYDDKPSPYSSIAGYSYISVLWVYPQHFYFSLSKHNPTQIIEESLDTNTMKYSIYSKSDFTYTYNEQGYPTQVKIKIVYPSSGTPDQEFYLTYDFTYSK